MTIRPTVSDHAVLRYLERARGFDIEGVRDHIHNLCKPAIAAGAESYKAEGVKFRFYQGHVVTVLANNQPSTKPVKRTTVGGRE